MLLLGLVPNSTTQNQYVGTGAQTVFATTFTFIAASDLAVTVNGVVKTLGVDYSVQLPVTDGGNGSVTFLNGAPANNSTVIVQRSTPYTQTLQLRGQGTFAPASIENALDREQYQIDQLLAQIQTLQAQVAALGGAAAFTHVALGQSVGGVGYLALYDNVQGKWWYKYASNGAEVFTDVAPA